MIDEAKDRKLLNDYLLKRLSDTQQQEVEARLLSEDEFYELLLLEEEELTEKYLDEEFTEEEKQTFETHFLAHPGRQEDLWLTKALRETAQKNQTQTEGETVTKTEENTPPKKWNFDFRSLFPILVPGFALILIVLGGIYVWFSLSASQTQKGLASLKNVYRQERPLETRISGFDYAPFRQTRGSAGKDDSVDLELAEKTLLEAVKNNPNARSLHALGNYYLTQRNFDQAIDYFNQALQTEPNNPTLLNDAGLAWMEKGKLTQSLGQTEKAKMEFNQSLQYFNQALAASRSLPEALFNRGKLYQQMSQPEKAEEDWREYLKLDAASKWAEEVRLQLKASEENQR